MSKQRSMARPLISERGDVSRLWRSTDDFLSRLTDTDDCIVWPGKRITHGYGAAGWVDKFGVAHRSAAHRVAYVWAVGPIPPLHVIVHTCGNPPCCNPRHLRCVTEQYSINHSGNKADAFSSRDVCDKCGQPFSGIRNDRSARMCHDCRKAYWRERSRSITRAAHDSGMTREAYIKVNGYADPGTLDAPPI